MKKIIILVCMIFLIGNVLTMSSSFTTDVNVKGMLTAEEVNITSNDSLFLGWMTLDNMGTHTYMSGDLIVHNEEEATTSVGAHAHNDSAFTHAELILEAGSHDDNSVLNILKNSPKHPYSPNASGIINAGGSLGSFIQAGFQFSWQTFTELVVDEFGDITWFNLSKSLMTLNESSLNANVDLIVNGTIYAYEIPLNDAMYSISTGILSGGSISINSSNSSLLDVTSGEAIITNFSNLDNPEINKVSWENQTIYPNLQGVRSKWIGIKRLINGSAEFVFSISFTAEEKRTTAILGRVWGAGTDVITGKGQYSTPAFGLAKTVEDLIYAVGSTNIVGNVYSANGANLLLDKSSGESFRFSAAFKTDPQSPNVHYDAEQIVIDSYKYHLQNSTSTITLAEIDPDTYDVNGVNTSVPSGKWTIQEIWYFPVSGTCHVLYGQDYYNSKGDAISALSTELKVRNADILYGSIKRSFLIVQQGATELDDLDTAELREKNGMTGGGSPYWERDDGILSPSESGDNVQLDAGGQLIITDMTQGSILFTGASGLISQDNSNLFWDDGNNRLGIGTTDPAQLLELSNTEGSASLKLTGSGAAVTQSIQEEYDINYVRTAGYAIIDFRALPLDGSSPGQYRFGIGSGSTGENSISLYEPNGTTIQTKISSSGTDTYFNSKGGDFGIGLTNPASKLDVNGVLRISGGNVDYLLQGVVNDFRIGPVDKDDSLYYNKIATLWSFLEGELQVGSGGIQQGLLYLVGAPTTETNGGEIRFYLADDYDTSIAYFALKAFEDDLYLGPDTDPDAFQFIGNDAEVTAKFNVDVAIAADLAVYTDTLFVDGAGEFVGINNDIPSYPLDVKWNMDEVLLNLQSAQAFGAEVGSALRFAGMISDTIQAQGGLIKAAKYDAVSGNRGFDMVIYSGNNAGAPVEMLRLSAEAGETVLGGDVIVTGNVGIGTTAPDRKLQVGEATGDSDGIMRFEHGVDPNWRKWDVGTGNGTLFGHNDNFGIRDDSSGTFFVIEKGTGNIGIGTTTPTERLTIDIDENNFGGLEVTNSDTGTNAQSSLILRTVDNPTAFGQDGTFGWLLTARKSNFATTDLQEDLLLTYRDNNAWRNILSIEHDTGNVGMGISDPISILHVYEDTSSTGFSAGLTIENEGNGDALTQYYLTDSGQRWLVGADNSDSEKFKITLGAPLGVDSYFTIDTNGDVGLGTSYPSDALDVVGNISLTGTVIPDNNCGIPGTAFTAEENAPLNDASYEWGFGNGGSGTNMRSVQLCSGVMTGISWRCATSGTNIEVAIAISDGGDSGCNCLSSGSQCISTCDIPFNTGNGLNGYTVNAGGAENCVLTWWVRYD